MRNITKKIIFSGVMYWIVFLLAAPPVAQAYIDPGTGSLIIQVAIAFVAGSLFFVKSIWRRLASLFRHDLNKENKPDSASQKNEDQKIIP